MTRPTRDSSYDAVGSVDSVDGPTMRRVCSGLRTARSSQTHVLQVRSDLHLAAPVAPYAPSRRRASRRRRRSIYYIYYNRDNCSHDMHLACTTSHQSGRRRGRPGTAARCVTAELIHDQTHHASHVSVSVARLPCSSRQPALTGLLPCAGLGMRSLPVPHRQCAGERRCHASSCTEEEFIVQHVARALPLVDAVRRPRIEFGALGVREQAGERVGGGRQLSELPLR